VAGGTDKYDKVIRNGVAVDAGHGFFGIRDTLIFDPVNKKWEPVQPMAHGRWYPTLVMLSNGHIMATSGLDEQGKRNKAVELNPDPAHAGWEKTREFILPLYPHLFLLRDGRLFYTGGKMDTEGDSDPLIFNPLNPGEAVLIKGLHDRDKCNQCASVILPPAQAGKIMILGGGPEDKEGEPRQEATRRVAVVDLQSSNPTYETKAELNHERMHVNSVLLPDRTVIAVGGGVTREASVQAGVIAPVVVKEQFEAEIFDPDKDTWSLTAKATVARLYHSVALLLPDGRVVAAGGNPDKGSQVNWLPPDPLEEMRLEIYSPPYLFKFDAQNPRPVIDAAPDEVSYGATITIQTPQAPQIKWINLIRPGLTTHSFNGEQRLVEVPFEKAPPNKLNGTLPNDRNLAPPGWYMLFLTDGRGVPSVAHWVHLS
jgi:hypothetical protein